MANIKVNSELCKGCKLCINVCPQKIIIVGEDVNLKGYRYIKQIQEEKCTGCQLCAVMCPESAIEVYK